MRRRDRLLQELEDPSTTCIVALARTDSTRGDLERWRKEDPEFLIAYADIARQRAKPARLPAVRRASKDTCHQVLAAFSAQPTLGLAAHCRAAGTTTKKLEAACAEDPKLADELEYAKSALVVGVEQAQIDAMHNDRKATAARERFLSRNASKIWKDERSSPGQVQVNQTVNLALLQQQPKAEKIGAAFKPLDLPIDKLVADDSLPGGQDE